MARPKQDGATPRRVTRKKLNAAYNKGYRAGLVSPRRDIVPQQVRIEGEHGKLASPPTKTRTDEVVINVGPVRISVVSHGA